jgi:4'-phosphopantetheinyl transferase
MPATTAIGEPLQGVHLLSLRTPVSNLRDEARMLVRQALREALSNILATDGQGLSLISQPGQPIRLAPPWAATGVSVSHESGCSLAALNLNGPVGIDLMRVTNTPADFHAVSRDYLGPNATARLCALPEEQRPLAFAQAWTGFEARMKCLALELGEWTPQLDAQLRICSVVELQMPAGWVAALAITGAAVNPVC